MIPQAETLNSVMDLDPAPSLRAGWGFVVIHPLHDAPEVKCNADHLGPIKMSMASRTALTAVRGYLVAIMLMGAYCVVEMASAIRHCPPPVTTNKPTCGPDLRPASLGLRHPRPARG